MTDRGNASAVPTLGVVGLGYVGLPLAVRAARKGGIRVIGFDVDRAVVDGVTSGRSHVGDVADAELNQIIDDDLFRATHDMSRLGECSAVSICVPTPLSKTRDPDVSHVISASEAVAEALAPGMLVVLESTTYPGTTRELVQPILERTGLKVGRDFHLCFSPERIDPGNPVWGAGNTPRVLGGVTPQCTEVGAGLYRRFVDQVVTVSSAEAAEFTKILENTFRAVNIALANEAAIIADRLGVDIWEVIDAAATKPFGFMRFTPGPGLGGHCIPVDPHYLAWKMRTLEYRTRIIDLASEINAEMPTFVVGKIRDVLNRRGKALNGARVLLLGVAYKKDVGDVRESPAFDVHRLLTANGAEVTYHDPHVPNWLVADDELTSSPLVDEAISESDVVVVLTDHSGIDYGRILKHAKAMVDTRRAVPGDARRQKGPVADDAWVVKG